MAVLEMSSASGFSLVRGNDRDLFRGNTFGTGQLLAHALRKGGAGRRWHWRRREGACTYLQQTIVCTGTRAHGSGTRGIDNLVQ